ncbi:MAG TPA: hypothetical protein VK403_03280, partial [Allosphingosinicella sp.]|nr:hypothetical protein [Allosphingosinicella sp.]
TFRELHPGRPVFTAIVDGEPGQCFSAALLEGGTEPLAADLRKEGDGRRLGFLKLVAGLAGVGLDALVQRDAARRVRRVTYVTAAAVTAMLAMALLTAFALNARAEAERQRGEAEGLVEFMLTDLRNKLRAVGRIEIMQSVNARALQHYGQQAEFSSLSGEALSRRARILHAIGEDELTSGDDAEALNVFQEAFAVTSQQLARDRKNLDRQLDHARSEYWIGRVHELRERWPLAQRQYQLFARAADRLIAARPDHSIYMGEVGWSRINLGNIQLYGVRNYEAAERYYAQAESWFTRAAKARPADPNAARVLANAYAWLADSYFMRRLYRQSLEARRRQHGLVQRLHIADPTNLDGGFRLAAAQRGLAHSLVKVGDNSAARTAFFEAYEWSRRLTARDPRNAEWLLLRAFLDCDLLYSSPGLPAGESRAKLKRDVEDMAAILTAVGEPRVAALSNCRKANRAGQTKYARGD